MGRARPSRKKLPWLRKKNSTNIRKRALVIMALRLISKSIDSGIKIYRAYAVRPANRTRDINGAFSLYLQDIRLCDPQLHHDFLKMSKNRFDELLSKIEMDLWKSNTTSQPVTPALHLAVTLRFLTSTESMNDIKHHFRLGRSTVSYAIYKTCDVIWKRLAPTYVKFPTIQNEWVAIANEFQNLWQFPLCLGALDGKHIRLQAPPMSGSMYYNHKGFYSIVLMACCDARYRFTYIDIGGYGRSSDAGLFNNSEFGQQLQNGMLNTPPPTNLPGSDTVSNYCFIGDEGFPFKPLLMRPYAGRAKGNLEYKKRIFNYRLSRARRIIENSFGILSSRFRIFRTEITANPDHAELLTKASICLHNYLLTVDANHYNPPGLVDYEDSNGVHHPGQWHQTPRTEGVMTDARVGGNRFSYSAEATREKLAEYFLSPGGRLSFQDSMIT